MHGIWFVPACTSCGNATGCSRAVLERAKVAPAIPAMTSSPTPPANAAGVYLDYAGFAPVDGRVLSRRERRGDRE